jgi:hypothetical protein
MVLKMPTADDLQTALIASATGSATNAVGFHISKAVDIAVTGLLNALLGETTDERRTEMNAHHDKLLEIVQKAPITPPRVHVPMLSPRERIEKDVRESNDHIRKALEELEKAHSLSKCGACRATLEGTINVVGEATNEILDASEKILAMQKLKEVGELPPDATYDGLNRNQKGLVKNIVQQFHPMREELEDEEEEEKPHGKKTSARKPATRKPKGGKARK